MPEAPRTYLRYGSALAAFEALELVIVRWRFKDEQLHNCLATCPHLPKDRIMIEQS